MPRRPFRWERLSREYLVRRLLCMRRLLCLFGSACVLAAGWNPRAVADEGLAGQMREVADRARTKIVVLKTRRAGVQGAATGFLARTGRVLTVGHAVADAGSITAWVNGVGYPAEVARTHPEYDLAVLALPTADLLLRPVELARSSTDLSEGEPLLILAGPSQPASARGEPTQRVSIPAAYRGRVSIRGANERISLMLAVTASVERGDSGSPVIRVRDGAVVGIVASREAPDNAGVSRTAYAVPIEAAGAILDRREPGGIEEFYLFGAAGKNGR